MKILVISRWFAPRNIIGAIRPTELCKYFAKNNDVTCVAELYGEQGFSDRELLPVKVERVKAGRVGLYSIDHSTKATETRKATQEIAHSQKKKSPLIVSARRFAAQLMHIIDEIEWTRKAIIKAIQVIEDINPDCVVTSYGPESSVLVGLSIKKRYPELNWVSDMRDPMTHLQQSWWRKRINGYWEKKMAKAADAITTISDSLGEKYKNTFNHKRVGVFVNGYDPEDKSVDLCKNDGILRIGYTGALYGGRRKMDVLFKAIKSLETHGAHIPLEVHYAGGDIAELYKQAESYDATDYIVNHGLLPRSEAQQLQEMCDILCVLSWNTAEEKGVLTGKFPEYLRLKKTVLALVSGEIPEAELTQRINDMHCGYSFEYCSGEEGYSKFENWMKKMLDLKSKGEPLTSGMEVSLIEQYSYDNISFKYEQFLKDLQDVKGQ